MSAAPDEKKRLWGTETYSKFDHLDSDSDSDDGSRKGKLDASATATQFNLGASKAVISDINLIEAAGEETKGLKEKAKRISQLPQRNKETWQVVVKKLRVWSASSKGAPEGDGAIPCRPYAVFITCLYPNGNLLSQHISSLPENPPSSLEILKHLFEVMLNPSQGAQRRPGKLVFPDDEHVGALFKAFASIKVEVSQLSEADGIEAIVSAFSQFLVKKDIARVGPTSEEPGLLAGAGVTPEVCKASFSAFARLKKAQPWKQFHERQGLRVRFASEATVKNNYGTTTKLAPMSVWVGIFGHHADDDVIVDGDNPRGIQVYFSRLDLEARLCPQGHKVFRNDEGKQPRCSYTDETAEEAGVKALKRTKPRKSDRFSAGALRSHWPSVKKFAKPLTERDEGLANGRKRWMDEEIALLYESQTMLPFDDHTAIERYELELPKGGSYPFVYQLKKGETDRASIANMVTLIRTIDAIIATLPSFDKLSEYNQTRRSEMKVTFDAKGYEAAGGGMDEAFVQWSPVYLEAEALATMKKQLEVGASEETGKKEEEEEEEVGRSPEDAGGATQNALGSGCNVS